jgi:rhodanese-related sulfurtransferase
MKPFACLVLLAAIVGIVPAQTPQNLSTEQLESYLKDKEIFRLDVREPKEIVELGSVEGYVNIPIGELEKRLSEIPKDKKVLTLCNRGGRAARAAEILQKNGYKVVGSCGLTDYKQKGKKLVYPKGAKG